MFVKWRLWFPLFLISSHEAQLFYLHSSLTLKKMRGKCCLLQAGVSWNPSKVGLISQEKRHQLVTHIMASSRLSHQHLPLFVSCGPVGWPRLVKANDLTVLVNLGYNRQFDDYLFEKKKKKNIVKCLTSSRIKVTSTCSMGHVRSRKILMPTPTVWDASK